MIIKLDSGHNIRLAKLNQRYTYEGSLLGSPNEELNNELLEHYQSSVKETFYLDNLYMIDPPASNADTTFLGNIYFEDDPLKKIATMNTNQEHIDSLGYVIKRLPLMVCSALFISSPLKQKDKDANFSDHSKLGVLWFQDAFAMPIDENIINHIKSVDWEKNAAAGWS